MSSSLRLFIAVAIVMISAAYAVLVAQDPAVASAVSGGYVAVLATVLVLSVVWKKP